METPHLKKIRRCLERIGNRGQRMHQVCEDWVALMFWALQRNDPEYLAVMRRYRNEGERGEREADLFAQAFAELLAHMQATNEEALGHIFQEYAGNAWAGQFFTPWDVAMMMAGMLKPVGLINDPACGAGVMIVASARNMTNAEIDRSHFVAQDVDMTCVMMTALNMVFFNLKGTVILGNTLALEQRRIFRTQRSYVWGGSLVEVDLSDVRPRERKPAEPVAPSLPPPPVAEARPSVEQLSLFGVC